jgi:hypothetical protein
MITVLSYHSSEQKKRKFHKLSQISCDCPLKDGESDAAEARSCADEAGGDDLRAEADSLEYLRPLIGLQGGDAHLSHHLQDRMDAVHNMQCCGSGMGNKSASPIILELRNHFWGLKYLNSLMQIRDGKNSDPGWKNNFLLNFIVKFLFC